MFSAHAIGYILVSTFCVSASFGGIISMHGGLFYSGLSATNSCVSHTGYGAGAAAPGFQRFATSSTTSGAKKGASSRGLFTYGFKSLSLIGLPSCFEKFQGLIYLRTRLELFLPSDIVSFVNWTK